MKDTFIRLTAAGAILCAAACGSQKSGTPAGQSPDLNGKATLGAPRINALTAGDLLGNPVCADFDIIPYQLSASTTPPWAESQTGQHIGFTTSGDPIALTVHNSDGTNAVVSQEILGCASGTPDTSGNNWGYWITASNFKLCTPDSGGTDLDDALTAIQPVIIDQPIDCETSSDTDLAISIPIDIPTTAQSGYVDVSASVDVTGVAVGCKQADIGTDNLLHWGETFSALSGGDPAAGNAVALVSLDEAGSNVISQYSGMFNDASNHVDPYDDYYATGEGSVYTQRVYQMFYNNVELGNPATTGGPTCGTANSPYLYVGTKQAQCFTDNTGYPTTAPATIADLADAVVMTNNPGTLQGWATATVRTNNDTTSVNYGKQYIDILSSAGAAAFPELNANLTPESYTGGSFTNLWNEGLAKNEVYFTEPFPILGVYPNATGWVYSTTAGQWVQELSFVVVATTPSGATTLFTVLNSQGYADDWTNLESASTNACLGLFFQGQSCVAPATVPSGTTGPCGLPQAQFTVP